MAERLSPPQERKEQEPVNKYIRLDYPGQGTQKVGMGKAMYDNFSAARRAYNEIDKILEPYSVSVRKLSFKGPTEELNKTRNTQLAVLSRGIAAFEVWKEAEGRGIMQLVGETAGHSLGEWDAFYTADVFSLRDTVLAVFARGDAVEEACRINPGGMVSASMRPSEKDRSILTDEERKKLDDFTNNYLLDKGFEDSARNTPGQRVVGGSKELVEETMKESRNILKQLGINLVKLNVAGAFHTSLMLPAVEILLMRLKELGIEPNNPSIPVRSNVTAQLMFNRYQIRAEIPRQLIEPVQWNEIVEDSNRRGITRAIELGVEEENDGILTAMHDKISHGGKRAGMVTFETSRRIANRTRVAIGAVWHHRDHEKNSEDNDQ